MLVLPWYGAETFGLHAVGQRVLAGDASAIALATQIRDQPVAMTMFTLGLLLLAASGIAVAIAWARTVPAGGWVTRAGWPLGVAMAAFTPQFFLPAPARMVYGVDYLAAAIVWIIAAHRAHPERGAYMMTATPTTQISAPTMS